MYAKKLKVAILCGGRSGEHEVSLLSAKSVISAIDRSKFDVAVVGIRKNGSWHLMNEESFLINPDDPNKIALNTAGSEILLLPTPGQYHFLANGKPIGIDVVFPVLHGTYGEDGTLQGMLDMLDVPYVGANYLGSAAAMDKDMAKRLFREAGLATADHLVFGRACREDIKSVIKDIEDGLGYPCFIKPANLGSSVGIHKATNKDELAGALLDAWLYDVKIIAEKAVADAREIECSVLGNEDVRASELGEIIPSKKHGFYSYDAKYLDPKGAELVVGVGDISPEVKKEIQETAIKAFKALGCEGMARADFFVERATGGVYINELNTIPGFTKISMYPKLWEKSGICYTDLITRLIELALERHKIKSNLKTDFKK